MNVTPALIYQPYFPPAVIVLAVSCAAVVAGWSWWRGAAGSRAAVTVGLLMRLSAITAVGFVLMGPSRLPQQDTEPTRTVVNFLVDASASMQTTDMPPPPDEAATDGDTTSRYHYALSHWLGPDRLATLRRHHEVRLYSFGDKVRAALPEPADATERQSHLVESTYQLLGTMPPPEVQDTVEGVATLPGGGGGGAVIVLSDGRDSRGTDAAVATQLAAARRIKLHTVTLGGANLTPDLALTATPRQPYLMVNEPGHINVRLDQVNAAGAAATFRIRHEGRESSQPIVFTDEARLRIEVPIEHAEPGLYTYELSVDPLPGEPEANNNAQTVFVEVTSERMRVLVLEGQPYWDTKFLAQSLRKDDRVELTQITQINVDRQERIVTRKEGPAVAPRNLSEWSAYDVVILGRGLENVLTADAAGALPEYVSERGGRVVFARGRAVEPSAYGVGAVGAALSTIEPVTWGRGVQPEQPLQLTDAGRGHPIFARLMQSTRSAPTQRDLPVLAGTTEVESLKPATRVLATVSGTGTELPGAVGQIPGAGVVEMPYGRGMVVGVLGEGLWRWSLAASDNEALVGVFDAFWSNMVRWLVLGADVGPGKDLALRLSGRSVALGDELTVTVVQRGEAADLMTRLIVTDPDGQEQELSLIQHDGADVRRVGGFVPATAGVHTVRVESPDGQASSDGESLAQTTKFTAYDGNTELLRVATDPALMRDLAEGSGGSVFDPGDPDALLNVLSVERAARLVPPTPMFIWDRGWVLAALLTWLGLEWLIRKKGGLL